MFKLEIVLSIPVTDDNIAVLFPYLFYTVYTVS